MRSLAGCGALVLMLACSPVAAEDAGEAQAAVQAQPVAAATEGLPPPSGAPAALAGAVTPGSVLPAPPLPITLLLQADLRSQRLTVTENGKVKFTWPISSGRAGFATRTGTFKPQWASRMWYSRQYEYAPMPHAVFFHRGTAFHGTSAVGMLGRPASHGCVRLAPGNAATLFKLVHKHGYQQTKIVVQGSPGRKEPAIARRQGRPGPEQAATRPGQRPAKAKSYRRYATQQPSGWPF